MVTQTHLHPSQPSVTAQNIYFGKTAFQTRPILFGKDSVRFGNAEGTLPDWAKKVPDPTYTLFQQAEDQKDYFDKLDKGKKGLFTAITGLYKRVWFLYWNNRKYNASEKMGYKTLPEPVRKRIGKYKWRSLEGWRDRLRAWKDLIICPSDKNRTEKTGRYKRMLITLMGPMQIKYTQAKVTKERAHDLPMYELILGFLSDKDTMKKLYEQMRKKCEKTKQMGMYYIFRVFSFVATPIAKIVLKRKILDIKDHLPLLNKVEKLPKSDFEAQLKKAKEEYNQTEAGKADPIESIGEALASGSIAQVFSAKTKSGKAMVIKALRPDATPAFFENMRPYAYYLQLLQTGTKAGQKARAAKEVESYTHFLIKECQLNNEKAHAELLKTEADRLGVTEPQILVPDFATSDGRSLVSTKFGDKDLADLSLTEMNPYKAKAVPGILKLVLLGNAKSLDMHDGNFRVNTADKSMKLLDHGRQVEVNENVHQALLNLTKAILEVRYPDLYDLYNKKTKAALAKLFELTPNSPWSQLLASDKKEDREKLETFLRQLTTPVKKSLEREKEHNASEGNNKKREEAENQIGREISLFSIWCNYELLSSQTINGIGALPALCKNPISKQDVEHYYTKLINFARPYFTSPFQPSEESTLLSQAKQLDIAQWCEILQKSWRVSSKLKINYEDISAVQVPDPAKAKLEEAAQRIKTIVESTLTTPGESKRQLLQLVYQHNHAIQLADQLIESLYGTTSKEAKTRQTVRKSILWALNSDFDYTTVKSNQLLEAA